MASKCARSAVFRQFLTRPWESIAVFSMCRHLSTPGVGSPTAASSVVQSTPIASAAITTASQHGWRIWTGVIAALIVLGAAGLGLYSLMHRPAALPFQKFIITRVTNSGKAAMAAISPDGRYVNIGDETDIWHSHREY